jgi:hypothetical protein
MRCVRCIDGEADVVAKAPDGSGAWQIYRCVRCNYGWRSTEPQIIIDPVKRDPFFQLDKTDLSTLVCPLPPP